MTTIEVVELPGKKGKIRTVFRVPLEQNPTVTSALGLGIWSGLHLKAIHTYDYENGYVEFVSRDDAEKYVGD